MRWYRAWHGKDGTLVRREIPAPCLDMYKVRYLREGDGYLSRVILRTSRRMQCIPRFPGILTVNRPTYFRCAYRMR
jgi:hypothetical protein